MLKRKLGNQGLVVSAQGLGCMGMSDFYGTYDEKESLATINFALDNGITYLDTADIYGPHTNETLVGKAIRGRARDEIVIASKFGIVRTDDPAFRAVNGRPEYVHSSCDASLKRLGLDYIDLYYQHRVDPEVPIEETIGAMSELVKKGRVRYLGMSEASPQTIRRAHATYPITALQTEYSLWSKDPEENILPSLRELGIGFVAYSPLGRGFLTGKIRTLDGLPQSDYRRSVPRFQGENLKKNLDIVDQINEIASSKGITAGQLALAWVQAQGKDIVSIPGTKRRTYLKENIAAVDVELTGDEINRINEIFPPGAASGMRYSEDIMRFLNK